MFVLSGFGDEIAPDLMEQMDLMEGLGIKHIEVRGVWGKGVLDLSDDELLRVKSEMKLRGFAPSAIGSPIGKIKITDDFDEHMDRFRRAIFCAKALDAPYIRLFSYFIPEGDDPADYRDEVMLRMAAKAKLAEAEGVTCLHENERHIYGDIGTRCRDILETVNSPNLLGIFDPANYVQCGVKPLEDCWPEVARWTVYMHVKDSLWDKTVTPAGEGDGQVEAILARMLPLARKQRVFLSLEPHLRHAGEMSGFSGADMFAKAADDLKKLLANLGCTETDEGWI